MTQSPLPPEIRFLPVPDRIHLVEQIWDSIVEDEKQYQLTDAQREELDHRLEIQQTSPQQGSSWDDVIRRILREE
jgi:putative addiction module component (TIGR02574 family)